jgi:hypothetical protein
VCNHDVKPKSKQKKLSPHISYIQLRKHRTHTILPSIHPWRQINNKPIKYSPHTNDTATYPYTPIPSRCFIHMKFQNFNYDFWLFLLENSVFWRLNFVVKSWIYNNIHEVLESWNFGYQPHLSQLPYTHNFEIKVPKGRHLREVFWGFGV